MARHAGKVITREVLLNHIWDFTYDGDTRIVDIHVSHLREKIGTVYIKTVLGVGYKFKEN